MTRVSAKSLFHSWGGQLTLYGRDSKIQTTDYEVGDVNIIYSTADTFAWAKDDAGRTTLILNGGGNERRVISTVELFDYTVRALET